VKTKYDWESVRDLFGKISDQKIADILGCKNGTVCYHRKRLGVRPSKRLAVSTSYKPQYNWNGACCLFGILPDKIIQRIVGSTYAAVTYERRRRNIKHAPTKYKPHINWSINESLLGNYSDAMVAKKLGICSTTVGQRRRRKRIPVYKERVKCILCNQHYFKRAKDGKWCSDRCRSVWWHIRRTYPYITRGSEMMIIFKAISDLNARSKQKREAW